MEILTQELAKDPLHVLFKAAPITNLANVVNVIKGVTAKVNETCLKTGDFPLCPPRSRKLKV